MNRVTGVLIIVLIVAAGFAAYIFDSKAQDFSIEFSSRNSGTGSTAELSWLNPDLGLVSLDLFKSFDKKNSGEKIKHYEPVLSMEKTSEVISNLTPRKQVFFSLVGNKKNGQQVYLGQVSVVPTKYPSSIIIAGQTPDRIPVVGVFSKDGVKKAVFIPFDLSYHGEVSLDRADFDGDGVDEIIVAPTQGLNIVKIYKQDGTLFAQLNPYENGYAKGVSVKTVDFYNYTNADSFFAVAPQTDLDPQDKGARSHPVRIYRYDPTRPEKFVVHAEFVPFEKFTGGVSLSAGDVNGDGHEELVATTIGGPAEVRIFNLCTEDKTSCAKAYGRQGVSQNTVTADHIFPYGRVEVQDIKTIVADLDNDGMDEIIVYPMKGRTTLIKVYGCQVVDDYRCLAKEKAATQVYNDKFRGGVNVAVGEKGADNEKLLIISPQQSGGPHVKIYHLDSGLKLDREFFPYNNKFTGGVVTNVYRFADESDYTLVTSREHDTDGLITLYSSSNGAKISTIRFEEAAPGYYLEIK